MTTPDRPDLPTPLERLLTTMAQGARFARAGAQRAATEFGPDWEADLAALLERLYPDDVALADAVAGYGAFAMDAMRRQKRFEQTLRYPATTYAEATTEVYHNDDYMRRQYLPGLLLSHLLWPHHYQQLRYFRGFFLPWLRRSDVDAFAEVGVGTGLYSRLSLQADANLQGAGFDISPMSLQFTRTHVEAFGLGARYTTLRHDILSTAAPRRFPAVLCIEVLEHLEDPVAMLRALRALCQDHGRLFVTAALNAANADHIHLYRDPQAVYAQVEAAGLHLVHSFFAQAHAPERPGLPVPSALAMVLTPAA
jgi:hypothetical protein